MRIGASTSGSPTTSRAWLHSCASTLGADGLSDDVNGDNVPDYYPTLYPGVLAANLGGTGPPTNAANQLIYEQLAAFRPALAQVAAFPFVFPGAYSRPQFLNNFDAGWIHSPEPIVVDANNNPYQFDLRASPLSPEPEPQSNRRR